MVYEYMDHGSREVDIINSVYVLFDKRLDLRFITTYTHTDTWILQIIEKPLNVRDRLDTHSKVVGRKIMTEKTDKEEEINKFEGIKRKYNQTIVNVGLKANCQTIFFFKCMENKS